MKNLFTTGLFLLVFVFASASANAQNISFDAAGKVAAADDQSRPAKVSFGSVAGRSASATKNAQDRFESAAGSVSQLVFHMYCSGQTLTRFTPRQCYLFAAVSSDDQLYADIKWEHLTYIAPSVGYRLDSTSYMSADTGGYGEINGFQIGHRVALFNLPYNGSDFGKDQFTVKLTNNQGMLVQEFKYTAYLNNYGNVAPTFVLDGISGKQATSGYNFVGRFPFGNNKPVFFWMGQDRNGGMMSGPDPQYAPRSTSQGTMLRISGDLGYNETSWLDVWFWDPETHEVFGKTGVVTERSILGF